MYKKKYNLNFNIFEKTIKNIKCPSCNSNIDVHSALYNQIFDKVQKDYSIKEKSLKEKEHLIDKTIKTKLAELGAKQYRDLSQSIKKDFEIENSERIKKMQEELNEKSVKIKNYNMLLADNERLKREKQEAFSSVQLEVNKKVNEILGSEKLKIENRVEAEFELRIKELQKQLLDQKKLTDEQRRKLNQGSVQLQGEAQEEAIEEWIKSSFPTDEVIEIKKGANGADCIQIINDKGIDECGSIYYESKNTKTFNDKWIQKFKIDMQEKKADIGVIISKTLPSEMKRMGLYKGIYVCTYEEFKGLCFFLRDFIIQFYKQQITTNNKGDKKEMLYSFVTSKEFISRIEHLGDVFKTIDNQLEKEKKQAALNFEKRRGALDLMKNNIFSISGRMSGITGFPITEGLEKNLDYENSFNLISLFQKEKEDFEC